MRNLRNAVRSLHYRRLGLCLFCCFVLLPCIILENWNSFLKLLVPQGHICSSSQPWPTDVKDSKRRIPRIVWRTWKTNSVPLIIAENHQLLQSQNPDYDFKLVTDIQAQQFMTKYFKGPIADAYFMINPALGAARADLWRYCVLYMFGGVYLDMDSTVTIPFDAWIRSNHSMILSYENNLLEDGFQLFGYSGTSWGACSSCLPRQFLQWLMVTEPRNPIYADVIVRVVNNIHNWVDLPENDNVEPTKKVNGVTGPAQWTVVVRSFMSTIEGGSEATDFGSCGIDFACAGAVFKMSDKLSWMDIGYRAHKPILARGKRTEFRSVRDYGPEVHAFLKAL